jgi:hypothetical protein
MKGRRGRRREQLLDSLKERRTWRLKDVAIYCTVRRTVYGQRECLVTMMTTGIMNPTRYYFCQVDVTVQ